MHSTKYAHGFPAVQKSNCAAVVSAYHPPQDLTLRVAALLEQFVVVVVVDDGGTGGTGGHTVIEQCRDMGAMTVTLESNQGIAAALNRGVSEIMTLHPRIEHIVTFDQDSTPPPDLLQAFDEAQVLAHQDGCRVGSLSPGRINGSFVGRARHGAAYSLVSEPIQSGLLIPLRVLREIGGFDETFFIDGVDTDVYWRMRRAGYVAIGVPAVDLTHQLGAHSPVRIIGRAPRWQGEPLTIMQSAPFRYYYLVRNRCELMRRYGRVRPAPMVRGLVLDLRHLMVVLVLGTARKDRARYALKGLADGLRGRSGKMGSANQQGREEGTSHE